MSEIYVSKSVMSRPDPFFTLFLHSFFTFFIHFIPEKLYKIEKIEGVVTGLTDYPKEQWETEPVNLQGSNFPQYTAHGSTKL
jgi:hypothetical protein